MVVKNHDGSELVYRRRWGTVEKDVEWDEYLWECVMTWPYGFCNLRLFSDNGKVTYEFDSDDIISAGEYIKNTSLYGFKISDGI